jgi:nicotinic acetylcholine receptor
LVSFAGQFGSFSMVDIILTFRRRTLFFSFNFVLPSVFITILSIAGFILPPKSGEKIGLQITNLLAVVFFLSYVSTIVPASSFGIAKISNSFF